MLSPAAALGQPVPKILTLSRDWLQRGTTNELIITGENLTVPKAIHISGDPGVTASIAAPDQDGPRIVVESSAGGISIAAGSDAKTLRVQVKISAEASLNGRELRVVTATGASNPVRVNVSPIAEILESQQGEEPQKLALPVGVSGTISVAGEQNTFLFDGKKGQELICDVLAFRTGSALDSSLVISNSGGKELARSEDAKGFDSFLHFKVPEDGEYLVQLRDFRYGGGPAHKYHLTIGELPCVDSAFPAGGQRGQVVEVILNGSSLGGINKLILHPEKTAPVGWQELRVRTPNGLSTAFPFDVSDLTEVLETEPNDTTNQANRVSLPVIINGRIQAPKDIDTFKFKAGKDQTFLCEVTAQRFGSPLDSLLTLRDAAGQVLHQNDDAEGADARIEVAVQKDQEYTLSVQDLLGRGGENFIYRLSIQPPEPDFNVKFSPDNPRIYCGGRDVLRCEVVRKAGFGGAVQLTCANLPQGISVEPVLLRPEDPSSALLFLSAQGQAAGGSWPLVVTGTGMIGGKRVSHKAEPFSGELPAQEALLTVVNSGPAFVLDALTLSVLLEQDQTSQVDVEVVRRDGFDADIKLTLDGYSAGREPLERNVETASITLKGQESRARLNLKAKADSEIGSRPIYVRGEATVDGQAVTQFSQPLPLTIRQLPFTLLNTMKRLSVAALPNGAKSAASEAEFAVRASRRGWFTDQIDLALEGLPEGVTATSTNLPSQVGEVTFKLTASDKAPAGKEFQITVVGSANLEGRTYRQKTVPMTLSITAPQDLADTK